MCSLVSPTSKGSRRLLRNSTAYASSPSRQTVNVVRVNPYKVMCYSQWHKKKQHTSHTHMRNGRKNKILCQGRNITPLTHKHRNDISHTMIFNIIIYIGWINMRLPHEWNAYQAARTTFCLLAVHSLAGQRGQIPNTSTSNRICTT